MFAAVLLVNNMKMLSIPVPEFAVNSSFGMAMTYDPDTQNTLVSWTCFICVCMCAHVRVCVCFYVCLRICLENSNQTLSLACNCFLFFFFRCVVQPSQRTAKASPCTMVYVLSLTKIILGERITHLLVKVVFVNVSY